MSKLAALQQNFMRHLYSDDDAILADIAASGTISPAGRMRIYRNNARLILTENLMRSFPAVVAMVDEKFFKFAADAFIRAHPPTGADLNDYGAALPGFLAGFAPLAAHPYIADLARLEWARHEAYLAADEWTGPSHPALRLIRSDWPVDKIWTMAQPGFGGEALDLQSGPVFIAVARDGMRVFHTSLDADLFGLLAGGTDKLAKAPGDRLRTLAAAGLVDARRLSA